MRSGKVQAKILGSQIILRPIRLAKVPYVYLQSSSLVHNFRRLAEEAGGGIGVNLSSYAYEVSELFLVRLDDYYDLDFVYDSG